MNTVRRSALITGCGKSDGMGQAIARRLAASGVAVAVSDLLPMGVLNARQEIVGTTESPDWNGVETLVAQIRAAGGQATAVLGDISQPEDAVRMVSEAVAFCGRLDILVNNAGAPQGADRQDIEAVPLEAWDRLIQVNLRGTYLMCHEAVPIMRKQRYGRIVNISSLAGLKAAPRSTAYSASKAGVIGLTRSLAMDVGAWGITVNAICPGAVGTSRAILNPDPNLDVEAHLAKMGQATTVGRVGRPEDIAAAVEYFSSEDAGYVTAQTLVIDGGGRSAFPQAGPTEAQA